MTSKSMVLFDDSELQDWLSDVEKAGKLDTKKELKISGENVKEVLEDYPAETIANSPSNPTGKWYERGYGPRSHTGWGKKTSEDLGDSWKVKATRKFVDIITSVSYAKWVQGFSQTGLHMRRDWPGMEREGKHEINMLGARIMDKLVRAVQGKRI